MKPEELSKGDLVLVRWTDASDTMATLEEHSSHPETGCKDWGIFLGISGARRRFVLIGKDVVEGHREWGATRIPLELVEEIRLLLPRDSVAPLIVEVEALGRRIRLRKRTRGEASYVRVS
jgi:hypothetical protein